MMKKNCLILICILVLFVSTIPAFADGDSTTPASINNGNKKPKVQFLSITRPVDNETTYKKTYIICGVTEYENIKVKLLQYNEDSDKYEDIVIDGQRTWTIGESGFFAQEISLKGEDNRIRVIAYKASQPDIKQISDFKINVAVKKVLVEDIKSKLFKNLEHVEDIFSDPKTNS